MSEREVHSLLHTLITSKITPDEEERLLDIVRNTEAVGGRYRIEGKIGRGGTAIVLCAYDKWTKEKVALKVLNPVLTEDGRALEAFRREAGIQRKLSHDHIVRVYDINRWEESGPGLWYISMEYLEAGSLRKVVAERRFSVGEALEIVKQVCKGLSVAHRAGALHLDIKPENVLIASRSPWRVKVGDFGLGVFRTTGLGTVFYVAPEQAMRIKVDQRADVWGIGCLFYELLMSTPPAGRFPLPSEVRKDTPRWADEIIEGCLRLDPALRFSSVNEILVFIQSSAAPAKVAPTPKPEKAKEKPPQSPKRGKLKGKSQSRLKLPFGYLVITSEPSGAEVYTDGEPSGKATPCELKLKPGKHKVELRLANYRKRSKKVYVRGGERARISENLFPAPERVGLWMGYIWCIRERANELASLYRRLTVIFGTAGTKTIKFLTRGFRTWSLENISDEDDRSAVRVATFVYALAVLIMSGMVVSKRLGHDRWGPLLGSLSCMWLISFLFYLTTNLAQHSTLTCIRLLLAKCGIFAFPIIPIFLVTLLGVHIVLLLFIPPVLFGLLTGYITSIAFLTVFGALIFIMSPLIYLHLRLRGKFPAHIGR